MSRYILVLLLICTYSHQASAYLDPGTGSMILQGVIAGIALAWLTIKTYWYKIKAFFGKETPTSLLDDDDNPDPSGDVR